MRACPKCECPLLDRQDRGDGQHEVCPTVSRERYLAWKQERMPGLVAHQERLAQGRDPFNDEEDQDGES